MTTVGIVGGLGPESTIDYYRRILEAWQRDDPSSAPGIVIDSLDVRRALRLVEGDRGALAEYLLASLQRLAAAGADFAAISANTPHIVFDELAARSPVPLLSIVETCAEETRGRGLLRVGLLGTRFTMEAGFYPGVFTRYGIAVVTPNAAERVWAHHRYVGELLRGEFRDETRRGFEALVERLRADDVIDGVILGGTELPLLLPGPVIAGVPALDTTALHVAAIVARLRQADAAPRAHQSGISDIVHDLPIKAPIDRVFHAVSSPEGLDAWWTLRSSGQPRLGGEYVLWFGPAHDWRARVTRSNPPFEFELKLVLADGDWTGTHVGFQLEDRSGTTWLRFSHLGWPSPNEHYRVSCNCWAMYLRILRRFLELGEMVPYEERLDA